MLVALEQARSMAIYAAMMSESEDALARRAALSAAKVQINASARFVGQTAVQLHGGVGMTMEYVGAHLFRRLAMIALTFGDADWHLRRVAQAQDLEQDVEQDVEQDLEQDLEQDVERDAGLTETGGGA